MIRRLLLSTTMSLALPLSIVGFASLVPARWTTTTCSLKVGGGRLFAEEPSKPDSGSSGKQRVDENSSRSKHVDNEGDILSSPTFLKRKLEVLQDDIAKTDEAIAGAKADLEEGKAEWSDKLNALEREALNIQDRMLALSRDGSGKATVEVARVVLEVMENFDRAFASIKAETDVEKEIDSAYRKAYDKIMTALSDLGVTEVETVGKEFDYEVHNAVMMRPSEYEEGIVCEELQKGFVMGNDLIRAAAVSVSAG